MHLLKLKFDTVFRHKSDNILALLKAEKYDAVIDFTGDKRCLLISKLVSKYNAGARVLFFSLLYKYRLQTSWVDISDKDFIYRKFEKLIKNSLSLELIKKDKSLPYKTYAHITAEKHFDIVFHLSGNIIRELTIDKEIEIIKSLSAKKLCIADYGDSERLKQHCDYFKDNANISFNNYEQTDDLRKYITNAKIFITYDGGHSHYSSQFIKTIVIFGSTSPYLWKPYEFEDYKLLKKWNNGVVAEKSGGKLGHIIIYYPVWCNPCFDIGCKTKPCLQAIEAKQVIEVVKSEL